MRTVITQGYSKSAAVSYGYLPASPPNPGSPFPYAFASEGSVTLAMDDTTLASLAGVDSRVVASFRGGVPDWKLKKAYIQVALAVGVDPAYLLSRIVRAERRAWSRQSNRFPGTDHTSYQRLTS